jgi:predicted transposase YdaD
LEPLLSFFASFVFDIPLVQQMMRWDMAVLRESPWYNEILKEGLQAGRREGLQEGLQEGRKEEAIALVLRQLTRRLGEISASRRERVRGLSLAQLEELGEALLDFTAMADLDEFLAQFE